MKNLNVPLSISQVSRLILAPGKVMCSDQLTQRLQLCREVLRERGICVPRTRCGSRVKKSQDCITFSDSSRLNLQLVRLARLHDGLLIVSYVTVVKHLQSAICRGKREREKKKEVARWWSHLSRQLCIHDDAHNPIMNQKI